MQTTHKSHMLSLYFIQKNLYRTINYSYNLSLLKHFYAIRSSQSTICLISPSLSFKPLALHSTNSTLNGFRSENEKSLSFFPKNLVELLELSVPIKTADFVTRKLFLQNHKRTKLEIS